MRTEAAVALSLKSCIPLQLADDPGPEANCLLFLQLYAWLHAVVDVHIHAVLTALEESGQADNTIVIFLADHGEYGAAHGMMLEKWYTAYQEAVHVRWWCASPAATVAGSSRSRSRLNRRSSTSLTSHIDILPTVLGFAGVDAEQRPRSAPSWR